MSAESSADGGIDARPDGATDGGVDSTVESDSTAMFDAMDAEAGAYVPDTAPDIGDSVAHVADASSIAPPRPRAPLSTARVTSHRPTLSWVLAPSTTGARIELCRERACTMRIDVADVSGSSYRPSRDLAPGVVYWRLVGMRGAEVGTDVSPTWQFYVGISDAGIDTSWGATPDFDGDGYSDIVAGAPGLTPAIYVFLGNRGFTAIPATTIPAPPDWEFTQRMMTAGDTNGDGFVDLFVGTNGQAHIYLGGPTGLPTSPSRTLSVDPFDRSSPGGDIDGDGYADILLSDSGAREGAVYVYRGSTLGIGALAAVTIASPYRGASTGFGTAISSAGDVDADGLGDFLVSASAISDPGATGSATFLYRGTPGAIPVAPDAEFVDATSSFGFTLASLGDVNGDGHADVAVGGQFAGAFGGGAIAVYFGTPSGLGAPLIIGNPLAASGGQFGFSISGAGDLNGDGVGDFAVGAPEESNPETREGVSFAFFGMSGATPLFAQRVLDSPAAQPRAGFGVAAMGIGDFDRDGFDDLVVGSDFRADPESDEGAVYVFSGQMIRVVDGPALAIDNPRDTPNALFGRTIASGGF